jgi:hypothetical protein
MSTINCVVPLLSVRVPLRVALLLSDVQLPNSDTPGLVLNEA